MALIVQDPATPVSNANSYQSLVDARALAATYAITLPVDDVEAETALINGLMLIQQHECDMFGTRSTEIQNTAYPRIDTQIRGIDVPSDSLPPELLIAQLMAAEAFGQGSNLFGGIDDGKNVASKTAGKVSITYFDNGETGKNATYPRFDAAMRSLLCKKSAIGGIVGGQLWS